MNIEGTYTLQAPPEDVWSYLMDQQVLSRTIPGVERLELIEKDIYSLVIHIEYAPLTGTYQGRATISEQQYPYHYQITLQGEGRYSGVSGVGHVSLSERDNKTIIAYTGTVTLGKLGARLPGSAAKGAAKLLIQQFFTALAEQLRTTSHAKVVPMQEAEWASIIKQPGGNIVVMPPSVAAEPQEKPTFVRAIVNWLALGGNDPVQQAQWERRVRRVGAISGLLLLVWIGTRLPRRR